MTAVGAIVIAGAVLHVVIVAVLCLAVRREARRPVGPESVRDDGRGAM